MFAGGVKKLREGLSHGRSGTQRTPTDRQLGTGGHGRVIEADGMRTEEHEVKNLDERVAYIMKMIRKGKKDPRIRKFTVQLCSKKCGSNWCISAKDWEGEVVACFEAVREHVRYIHDTYGVDLFQHPVRTLEFAGEDCDGLAIVLGSMLQSIGFKIWLRVIRTTASADWDHIYLIVEIPPCRGKKMRRAALDASVNKAPGWEAPARMVVWKRDYEVPA